MTRPVFASALPCLRQLEITSGMKFFCVSHRRPRFDPGRDFVCVAPQADGDRETLLVPEDHFGLGWEGQVLSEYAQLFGLADALAAGDRSEDILLFQYRKFVSIRHSGQRWEERPYAFACSPDEAEGLFVTDADLALREGRTLVGPLVPVPSLAAQYAQYHPAEDFTRFGLALTTVEGFDLDRSAALASCRFLIPSPALGIFSVPTFLRHMSILHQAWAAFLERYYVPREGYQRRVGGFLLERLHSFLLLDDAARDELVLAPGYQMVVLNPPSE
jgi:hypothetical protein